MGLIYDSVQQLRNGHPKNKAAGYGMIFPEMFNYVDKAGKTVLLSALK